MPLTYDLPGKTILLHNRHGVRIELNFDRLGLIELWISPLAGRSLEGRVRNFSNRDDHTRLFDRIQLPGLSEAEFVRCDYDVFHTVVHFKKQTLHVVSLFDRPGLVVWCGRPQLVDFKSDKSDAPVVRDARRFVVEHPDRGFAFHFAAVLEKGASFTHQLQLDTGRSTYARASLPAGARLVIAGGLADERVAELAGAVLRRPLDKFLAAEAKLIAAATAPGAFTLRGQPKLQRLLDINRRVLVSMQDTSGAIRAALNRIYYLIWVRDGAIIEVMHGHAGSLAPLEKWTEFLLANPTRVEGEKPAGRTFLMLVNKLTKWEEDGIFYAVWSAFNAWTQSGDERWRSPETLAVLADAMDWLERRCLDKKRGLFGRFFACETPLPGSRDDGFDNAVGNPTGRSSIKCEGVLANQSFDIYINLYAYSAYGMLAALHADADPGRADDYLGRARALGEKLAAFIPASGLPDYGDILCADGRTRRAGPVGLDITDYAWALSLTPHFPQPWRLPAIRRELVALARAKPDSWFLAAYFSVLANLDPEWCDEPEIMDAIGFAAEQCYRPGAYLAMPYTVVEMFNQPDGHPWHDVRPQAFSIGPWLATVCGLGLRRQPHGLAVRAGRSLSKISAYEYRHARIDATFAGSGEHVEVTVNGRPLAHALQIPEDRLAPRTAVAVRRVRRAAPGPVLVGSTVRLDSLAVEAHGPVYSITGYGLNTLELRGRAGFALQDAAGGAVPFTEHRDGDRVWLMFEGRGRFTLHARS
jgi:hypothetical protein